MLSFLLPFILCTFPSKCLCSNIFKENFITNKMQYVNDELNIDILNHPITQRSTLKDFKFLSDERIPLVNFSTPYLVNLFNKTYIFDRYLYEIKPSDVNLALDQITNSYLSNEKIDFIRSIYYNNTEFILMSHENGITDVYLAENINKIKLMQSIQNPDSVKDSDFFINNCKLYLVIVTRGGSYRSSTLIYEWLGTYFDVIDESFSTNANALYVFPYKNSQIITILQHSNPWHEQSLVYEFKTNKMKKVQLLPIEGAYYMTKYIFENQIYFIIMNKGQASLYIWQELEMVHIADFSIPEQGKVIHLTYINSLPLIFTITQDKILIYNPTEDFKLLINSSLEKQFANVFNLQTLQHGDKQFLYFFGKTIDDQIELVWKEFTLYSNEINNKIYNEELLPSCLSSLQNKLEKHQIELNIMQKEYEKEASSNKSIKSEELEKTSPVLGKPVMIEKLFETEQNLYEKYLEIFNIINEITLKILDVVHINNSEIIFDSRVTSLGDLQAANLKAKHITIEKLNSVKWNPNHWLSYNTEQVINGTVKVKYAITNELLLPKGNIFEKALLLNGNQKLYLPVKFNSLKITDLYTKVINDIPLDHLYFRGLSTTLNGSKTFNKFITNSLDIDYLNKKNASDIIKFFTDARNREYKFSPSVIIKNLDIENINDVNWKTFKDSIYKKGETNSITGNLKTMNLKVANLNTETINGIYVKDFLTTSTDQIVNSKIHFGNVDTKNINCSDINGISFATDLMTTLDKESKIIGPVTIHKMYVMKDMHYNNTNKTDSGIYHNHFNEDKQHLQQIYKKVKILGNVRIENFFFQPNTNFKLNGRDFSIPDSFNKYWLKHTHQIIPIHVKILNGMNTPNLITNLLNSVEVKNYMRNNLEDKLPTNYHFQNVTIIGNVTIDDSEEHFPNLIDFNETSVKRTGEYEIYGQITFNGELTVNKAKIDLLDDIRTNHVVTVLNEGLLGKKEFEHLIVRRNVIVKDSYINHLNDIELKTIYNTVLPTHKPIYMDTFRMTNITVKSLKVNSNMNGENLNKYILNLDNLHAIEDLNNVDIIGNTIAFNITKVVQLNRINFNVIAEKAMGEPVILGNVKFTNNLHIKNFQVRFIDNINIIELTPNLMYRNFEQRITAKQYFNILRTPLIICDYINNIDMKDTINVKNKETQTLILRNKLVLKSGEFLKSLSGNLPCNIEQVTQSIQSPPTRNWSSITISKNLTVASEENILSLLLKNAVTLGEDNIIFSKVMFSRVSARNVYSEEHINNVNIQEIYEDALLKNNQNELITGIKTFHKITVAGAVVYGETKIPLINKLSIEKIDKSIIHKNEIHNIIIKGNKTFAKGLQTSRLNTPKILNIKPENLVSFEDLKPIPQASFDTLHILHNFDTFNVNKRNFTQFLSNRVLKHMPTKQVLNGIYYFDDININGNTSITMINNIKLDDVVIDEGVQTVSSRKKFNEDLVIISDIHVKTINGTNITEKYTNSILIKKEVQINANMNFEQVSEITSNISTNYINGIPIDYIKATVQSETPNIKAKTVQNTIDEIDYIIKMNYKVVENQPIELMYLDIYREFDISIPNARSSQVIETNGHVIMHILNEKQGHTCGLPEICTCLVQNTIQVTLENSFHLLANKANQRVYSYKDDAITVHLITDSISYNPQCKNSNLAPFNEYTTLTWTNLINGQSFVFNHELMNSYVTGVEFFAIDSYLYIVMSMSYNIQMDSQNLDCLVLKLDKHKNQIEIIQKIPTTASKFIHLFHTAQGINLIIGNQIDSKKLQHNVSTSIYKFNYEKGQFTLLREMYGINCLSATSVIIGLESFIIFGQENARMVLWKYNHNHENYYLYQNIILDSSVTSTSVFYSQDSGNRDAFITCVTDTGNLYIYTFQHIEGWKLINNANLKGLRILVPFNLNNHTYLFAPSSKISSLLIVVEYGQY